MHNFKLPMRRIFIITVLLISFNSICQTSVNNKNIIGIWQAETNEVSSNYHDTYRFYKNNKFAFEPSQYDGLKRIVQIAGTYKIHDAKIVFYVHSIQELVGNKIERSMITTLSDSWAIDGGKLVTKKIKSLPQEAKFEFCESIEDNKNCLKIDGRLFYEIEE